MKISPSLTTVLLVSLVWNTSSQILPGQNDDIVKTSSGPIRGTEVRVNGFSVNQYLGIPFAKPPVGKLRFKKPQPVEPWSETYVADTMPPACIQYSEYPFPWKDFQDGKSEDCLYLNIWVPKTLSLRKMPVLFWIYGGGFILGSNRKPLYDGQVLAARGDVVVVTMNYRLAAFGFLTSGTEAAPGNQGVYDMVEALKWVNKNIVAFGGDPKKVTLVGESAGSISIGLLCVSPLTKGLFRSVIMESGSPAYLLAESNTANIAKSQQLAEAVGCAKGDNTIYDNPDKVVDCLREVDAFTIAKTLNSFNSTLARTFFPMYGDEVLPMNARKALIEGKFHNVDVLIGNNRDEGSYQITTEFPDVFGFFGEKNPRVNKSYGNSLLMGTFSSFPNPDAMIQHYLGDVDDDDYDKIRYQVYTAVGDFSLLCPTVYFAESYSKAGNKVHYYFFVHRPSTTPWAKWMGVAHFEEVQFVFGLPLQAPKNYTASEGSLSREMVNIWTNFVKHGSTGRLGWPLYSRENPIYVELDTGVFTRYGEGPHKSNCDFFREFFGFK